MGGEPGEFTRLMGGGSGPKAPMPAGTPGPEFASPSAHPGPGDFTRIVAGVGAANAAPAFESSQGSEALDAEPPRLARSPRVLVLIGALALLGVVAVVLVLYFALKAP
jgi:hypothetical protein